MKDYEEHDYEDYKDFIVKAGYRGEKQHKMNFIFVRNPREAAEMAAARLINPREFPSTIRTQVVVWDADKKESVVFDVTVKVEMDISQLNLVDGIFA